MRESYDVENRISGIIGNNRIAVCQFGDFTGFQWRELRFPYYGLHLLLGKVELDLIGNSGEHKNIFLSRSRYFVHEYYFTHSPVFKKISPNSFALLSKTGRQPRSIENSILIQTINHDEYNFINKILETVNSNIDNIRASLLAEFKWDSVQIEHFRDQYFYQFVFFSGDVMLEIPFAIPCNIMMIDHDIFENKNGVVNSDEIIRISVTDGVLSLSAVEE